MTGPHVGPAATYSSGQQQLSMVPTGVATEAVSRGIKLAGRKNMMP